MTKVKAENFLERDIFLGSGIVKKCFSIHFLYFFLLLRFLYSTPFLSHFYYTNFLDFFHLEVMSNSIQIFQVKTESESF